MASCDFLLGCCCVSVVPPQPLASPQSCAPQLGSPTAAPGTRAVGAGRAGQGWSVLRGSSCCRLSPCTAPTGAAVPGGGGAGAGPCGAVLPAVPAPAQGHGGALWAAGCFCAGPGPGLCGGFAAALLPDCPARESRERGPGAVALGMGRGAALAHGTGAGSGWVLSCCPESQSPALAPWMVPSSGAWCSSQRGPGPGSLLPWAGAWAPLAPAWECQSFPAAPCRDIGPARPCGHLVSPVCSQACPLQVSEQFARYLDVQIQELRRAAGSTGPLEQLQQFLEPFVVFSGLEFAHTFEHFYR